MHFSIVRARLSPRRVFPNARLDAFITQKPEIRLGLMLRLEALGRRLCLSGFARLTSSLHRGGGRHILVVFLLMNHLMGSRSTPNLESEKTLSQR